jgi:hypothetical protein
LFAIFAVITVRNPAFHGLVQEAQKIAQCEIQLQQIGEALRRYEVSNDHYPRTLEELYPEYLSSRSVLRCPSDSRDPKTGPSSYTYRQVSPNAPKDTVLCTCSRHQVFRDQPAAEIRLLKSGDVQLSAPEPVRGKPLGLSLDHPRGSGSKLPK